MFEEMTALVENFFSYTESIFPDRQEEPKDFLSRTAEEQALIEKAYEFEIDAIKKGLNTGNPYTKDIRKMGLWDAFNDAVEMAFQ